MYVKYSADKKQIQIFKSFYAVCLLIYGHIYLGDLTYILIFWVLY